MVILLLTETVLVVSLDGGVVGGFENIDADGWMDEHGINLVGCFGVDCDVRFFWVELVVGCRTRFTGEVV